MPPASDPALTAIADRLDTIEQRLTAMEAKPPLAQPDKHGKLLGMTIGVVLLLLIAGAGMVGLIALWKSVL